MKLVAEYVSPGHPDRICDNIMKAITKYVLIRDFDALVGLECAVHTNKVFIDGRIAAGKDDIVITHEEIDKIIRDIYKKIGYSEIWKPAPGDLEIIQDVCIEKLSDDERMIRKYSDDQNIVTGYACKGNDRNVPFEHYLADMIGNQLSSIYLTYRDFPDKVIKDVELNKLGPDFKVLVELNCDENEENEYKKYSWERLTLSWQHSKDYTYEKIYNDMYNLFNNLVFKCQGWYQYENVNFIDKEVFHLNGAGDFIQGGPEGDNGLSGKKLVIDFYGPRIPIGGGAIWGKDIHKVDVCGAYRARELAKRLLLNSDANETYTKLAWSPGEEIPYYIEAYSVNGDDKKKYFSEDELPTKDWFSIDCIANDYRQKLNSEIIQI